MEHAVLPTFGRTSSAEDDITLINDEKVAVAKYEIKNIDNTSLPKSNLTNRI